MSTTAVKKESPAFSVGSIVRIPRGANNKTGKATILTIDNDDEVSLLREDAAPVEGRSSVFIAAPKLSPSSDQEEVTISKADLQALCDFETTTPLLDAAAAAWKDCGDTLLKLGDTSAAIPYYERALQLTSNIQIGSTVLLATKKKKNDDIVVVAAEIDCMDADDGTADVTFVASGKETVVNVKRDILLAASLHESEFQIRVLLNLARCLLQLAEFDNTPLSRPSAYRKGAVLACSLAYELLLLQDEDDEVTSYHMTSLLLRSKAQAGRAKWPAAMTDIGQLLKYEPQSKQGRKWRTELMGLIAQHEQVNKKLVKGMCQWIQTATNEEDNAVSDDDNAAVPPKSTTTSRADSNPWSSIDWISAVLVLVVVALWMYQSLSK